MGVANKAHSCSDVSNRIFVIYSTTGFTTCELQTFIPLLLGIKYETIAHSQYSRSINFFPTLSEPHEALVKSGHEETSLPTDANRKIIKNTFAVALEEIFSFSVFQCHRLSSSDQSIYGSPTPLSKDCSTLHQESASALHTRKKPSCHTHVHTYVPILIANSREKARGTISPRIHQQ